MLKVPGNVHLALQKALLFRSCLFRGKNFDYFCSENLQVWDYPVIWKVPSALDSNDAISFEEYVSWQLLHSDTRKKWLFLLREVGPCMPKITREIFQILKKKFFLETMEIAIFSYLFFMQNNCKCVRVIYNKMILHPKNTKLYILVI